MKVEFYKYQGTGNDFVMIDNRSNTFPKEDIAKIAFICDRRIGVGADGLILLENDEELDFKMVYYNADGSHDTMCGNGGRCIVSFAKDLGIIENQTSFLAVGQKYEAEITPNGIVKLHMLNVTQIDERENSSFLNTGSPHHVQIVSDLEALNVQKEGEKIRYGLYGKEGSNINFVSHSGEDSFNVRTYERGVEGETLSCGTGVTAVALAMHHTNKVKGNTVNIETKGGKLSVSFKSHKTGYSDVFLSGPAKQVFRGEITW